jgi:hypothetical protein
MENGEWRGVQFLVELWTPIMMRWNGMKNDRQKVAPTRHHGIYPRGLKNMETPYKNRHFSLDLKFDITRQVVWCAGTWK